MKRQESASSASSASTADKDCVSSYRVDSRGENNTRHLSLLDLMHLMHLMHFSGVALRERAGAVLRPRSVILISNLGAQGAN